MDAIMEFSFHRSNPIASDPSILQENTDRAKLHSGQRKILYLRLIRSCFFEVSLYPKEFSRRTVTAIPEGIDRVIPIL